jgi:hypothetical protein
MERNNKEWTEINEIETKRMIERINETKSWLFDRANKIANP